MKLKRTLKELLLGDKTYLPKEKKPFKTTRTKAIDRGLTAAGIDWEKDKPSVKLLRKKK